VVPQRGTTKRYPQPEKADGTIVPYFSRGFPIKEKVKFAIEMLNSKHHTIRPNTIVVMIERPAFELILGKTLKSLTNCPGFSDKCNKE